MQESFHINSEQAELICSDRNKNSGFWLPWGLAGKEHRGNLEEVKGSLQLAERWVRLDLPLSGSTLTRSTSHQQSRPALSHTQQCLNTWKTFFWYFFAYWYSLINLLGSYKNLGNLIILTYDLKILFLYITYFDYIYAPIPSFIPIQISVNPFCFPSASYFCGVCAWVVCGYNWV